jgi:hypothetical protein
LVHCLYDLIRPGTEGSGTRDKRERARARLRASGKERRRERAPAPERVPSWALMHMFKKGVTCIQAVTCIEQAWAPSLVSDGAGRPSAGARLCRADATGGWTRWRPGGRPRRRGQLPTAPAPPPAQTCARCTGRTRSGQLAVLSAVNAGVPTTRSLYAAPAGGWRSADGPQPAAGSRPGVFHVRGRPPAAGQVDGGGRGRVRLP